MIIPIRLDIILLGALTIASGLSSRRFDPPQAPDPVARQFLSGKDDEWEPSLAVGGDNSVHVIASRMGEPLETGGRGTFSRSWAVVRSSHDGGKTFAAAVIPSGDQFDFDGGDARIRADAKGN